MNDFSFFDVLNFIIISIVVISLLILFKLEKLKSKQNIFLKATLIFVILSFIIDVLIFLELFEGYELFIPVAYFFYFCIYPSIYLYFRELAFNENVIRSKQFKIYFLLPVIIFIGASIIYYPLPIEEKISFLGYHLSDFDIKLSEFTTFQFFVIPAYYFQFFIYVYLSIKIIIGLNKQTSGNIFELKINRYIALFITGVIIYEVVSALSVFSLSISANEKRLVELVISLFFVLFGLYIGINQTLIQIQSAISRISDFIDKSTEPINIYPILLEDEMNEIKQTIENYMKESKIYLDPNLNLDLFSRKVHIQSRKISNVINNLLDKNFHQFLNEYRITAAIEIIQREEDINFENLYTKLGFNSRSTFNRVFKEITGKTPSEFNSQKKTA